MTPSRIHIVFDGPPDHQAGRFVEVEDDSGASISAGRWVEAPIPCPRDTDGDGHCALGPVRCREEGHQSHWHLVIDRTGPEQVCTWLAGLTGVQRSQVTLTEIMERAEAALDPERPVQPHELLLEAAHAAAGSGGLCYVHPTDAGEATFVVMTADRYGQIIETLFPGGGAIPTDDPEWAHEHVSPGDLRDAESTEGGGT